MSNEITTLKRRDYPTLYFPRFDFVFFSTLRTVSWEILSVYLNSPILSASKRKDHRAYPLGALLQLRATRCASKSPSVLIGPMLGYGFRSMHDSNPSSTNLCFTRSTVLVLICKTWAICSLVIFLPNWPSSEFIRIQAFRYCWEVCFPLLIKAMSCSLSSFVRSCQITMKLSRCPSPGRWAGFIISNVIMKLS